MSARASAAAIAVVACVALLVAGVATGSSGTVDDETLWKRATVVFRPLPGDAPSDTNPVTTAKVELGKALYFDPRLSKEGNISCDSCHTLARFGVDQLSTSPGDAGEHGERNSPTVLNAALHAAQFWDGRAEDVETQAGMPILNPVEMAIPSERFLVDRLAAVPGYRERFAAAFPGEAEPLTYANIGRALAAFERTLLTPAPFDAYLRGDRGALTAEEKEGLQTFLDLGCSSCHNGAAVGGYAFRKFGLSEPYWVHTGSPKVDQGRAKVTGDDSDLYVFKVAALRNVAETYPYFHDGSVTTLEQAVSVMAHVQTGTNLEPDQARTVAAFLGSLTGEVPAAALVPPAPIGEEVGR